MGPFNGDFSHVGFAVREGLYAYTAFHIGLVQTLEGVAVRPGRFFAASYDGSRRRKIDFSTAIFEKVAQNGTKPLRSCSGYDLCALRLSSPDWCALGCKSISQATLTVSGVGKATIFSTPKVLEGEIFGTSSTGTIGSMAEPLNAVDSGSPLLVMVHGRWRIAGVHLCSSPWRFKALGEIRHLPENYAATISALDRIRVLCGEHSFIDDSVVELEDSDLVPLPSYYCEVNTDETHSASKPKRQHKQANIDGGRTARHTRGRLGRKQLRTGEQKASKNAARGSANIMEHREMYKIRKQLPFYSEEEKIQEFYRRQEEKEAERLAREEEYYGYDNDVSGNHGDEFSIEPAIRWATIAATNESRRAGAVL